METVNQLRTIVAAALLAVLLSGCGLLSPSLDTRLASLLEDAGVRFPEELPSNDPNLVQLGEALFWDPVLSGNKDTACATCHHPNFGTSDGLSLPIGTGHVGIGPERRLASDRQFVPRNTPDVFNRGLPEWRTMFWDSRVTLIDGYGYVNPAVYRLPEGLTNVLAVQAMFPPTSDSEMRGDRGDADIYGNPNQIAQIKARDIIEIWSALMDELLRIPAYKLLFEHAYPNLTTDQLGFQHAANALAAYQAEAFTFLDSPWDRYLAGDLTALPEQAKRGALLFYGEAGCSNCHSGFLLTDQLVHNLAVPQIGPGRDGTEPYDLGRLHVTGEEWHRFSFRTPPLRNVTLTGPYMHNGAFTSLEAAVEHMLDPEASLRAYDPSQLIPELQEMVWDDPQTLELILHWLDPLAAEPVELDADQFEELIAFLESLTSPSAVDLSHLIPESVPSGLAVGGP